ncbi:hypothetical protein V1478_008009 [Vespula squamosa]|uniref:Uncharacterized protein n=1 Tax=Vespula squamosa TaxID=30214 RepID=A0ABD2AXJ5_VESSQ
MKSTKIFIYHLVSLAHDPRGYNIPKEEEEEEEKEEKEEKEGEKESEKINDYDDEEERREMINAGVEKKDDGVKENNLVKYDKTQHWKIRKTKRPNAEIQYWLAILNG